MAQTVLQAYDLRDWIRDNKPQGLTDLNQWELTQEQRNTLVSMTRSLLIGGNNYLFNKIAFVSSFAINVNTHITFQMEAPMGVNIASTKNALTPNMNLFVNPFWLLYKGGDFNEKFIDDETFEDVGAILLHEYMHLLFNHHTQFKFYVERGLGNVVNIATDCQINQDELIARNVNLTNYGITLKSVEAMVGNSLKAKESSQYYFEQLMQRAKEMMGKCPHCGAPQAQSSQQNQSNQGQQGQGSQGQQSQGNQQGSQGQDNQSGQQGAQQQQGQNGAQGNQGQQNQGGQQGNQGQQNQGGQQGNQGQQNQGGQQGNQGQQNQGGQQGNQGQQNQGGQQGNQGQQNQGGQQGNQGQQNQGGQQGSQGQQNQGGQQGNQGQPQCQGHDHSNNQGGQQGNQSQPGQNGQGQQPGQGDSSQGQGQNGQPGQGDSSQSGNGQDGQQPGSGQGQQGQGQNGQGQQPGQGDANSQGQGQNGQPGQGDSSQSGNGQGGQQSGSGQGNQQGQGGSQSGQSQGNGHGQQECGNCGHQWIDPMGSQASHGVWYKTPSDVAMDAGDQMPSKDAAEATVGNAVKAAMEMSGTSAESLKSRGLVAGEILDRILTGDSGPSKLPIKSILLKGAGRLKLHERRTYTRINPKQGTRVQILRGTKYDNAKNIWVFLDNSGSMGAPEINFAMGEIAAVAKKVKASLTVYPFDTKVYHKNKQEASRTGKWTFQPVGRGGTSFQPVFDYLKHETKANNQNDLIIVITDGYGESRVNTHGLKNVIWLLVEETRNTLSVQDPVGQVAWLDQDNKYKLHKLGTQ